MLDILMNIAVGYMSTMNNKCYCWNKMRKYESLIARGEYRWWTNQLSAVSIYKSSISHFDGVRAIIYRSSAAWANNNHKY